MAAMEAANTPYHNGPLPASPTLTNPDMILPDYDRSDSPDPGFDGRGHAELMMWSNTHAATSSADIHQMFVATGLGAQRSYGLSGPITPTTPIIYGNGTMLSDIGEVTEVESVAGKPSPPWSRKGTARRPGSPSRGSGSDSTRRSSPTIGAAAMPKKKSKQSLSSKRERRSSTDSNDSNSTIKTEDHAGLFADFSDAVSVGDSVFQGDDEESLASSYVEGTAAIEPGRLAVANIDNADRLSTYSTTSLSRRAEEILANAKQRLTTMEGNLTRARSSLHFGSPSGSEASTTSPPLQRAAMAMHSRDSGVGSSTSTPNHSPGHTRMSSDVAMGNAPPYRVSLQRSQSALGAAGGYRQPLTASKSADPIRREPDNEPSHPRSSANSVTETGPKPLTEDEVARLGEPDSTSQSARLEAFLSPTFGSLSGDNNSVRNIQRSSSAAQMRDIKEQMRDLKGKISSLREQARADSLKRRSLQSLRTPSPFTHSQIDQWYAEPPSNRTSEIITSSLPGRNPWNGEESSVDGDGKEYAFPRRDGHTETGEAASADAENGMPPGQTANHPPGSEPLPPAAADPGEANGGIDDDVSDMLTQDGNEDQVEDFHDADDMDYQSESGESLYHDTVQHQISHEDREDAFDYEHFFLHSAMGTMSLLPRRRSTESFSSEDSAETTRGPVINGTNGSDRALSRPNSSASISTVETFATAQERRSLKSQGSHEDGFRLSSDGTYESPPRAASAQSHRYRPGSSATTKRFSFSAVGNARPYTANNPARDSDGSISPIAEEGSATGTPTISSFHANRRGSVIHRPLSTSVSSSSLHRPSVSSFDSVGTTRSFPLVNKGSVAATKANSTGVLTPRGSHSSEDHDPELQLNNITARLMSELASSRDSFPPNGNANANADADGELDQGLGDSESRIVGNSNDSRHPHPLEALLREDKYLVERLVESLGRCVLGLTENGRASAESRMYRRRMDAAMRVLEGLASLESVAATSASGSGVWEDGEHA